MNFLGNIYEFHAQIPKITTSDINGLISVWIEDYRLQIQQQRKIMRAAVGLIKVTSAHIFHKLLSQSKE